MTKALISPSDPNYNRELRDAVMDQAPFYDPNHRCNIVREKVFRGCLEELRERERIALEKLAEKETELRDLLLEDRAGEILSQNADVEAPAAGDSDTKQEASGGLPRTPCSPS